VKLSTTELRRAAGDVALRTLLGTLGTTHGQWTRYSETGIPLELADRWSERIGAHPAEVWGGWVAAVLAS
jgi:hypothetical protein